MPTLARMAAPNILVMAVQMFSAGGMGGAIQSAVSRTLGADRRAEAGILAWHAAALGLGLGVATSLVALPFGPMLFAAMGGSGGSLRAATTYASIVLGGAVLLWLFNALFLAVLMAGGIMSHLRAGDPVVTAAPALWLPVLLCSLAFARRNELSFA